MCFRTLQNHKGLNAYLQNIKPQIYIEPELQCRHQFIFAGARSAH